MLLGAFAVALVSCGNDDEGGTPEPEPEPCTFAEDPDCFCDENPTDPQCEEEEPCTFEEDPECFCEENPEAEECQEPCVFEEDPVCFCIENPDDELCEPINTHWWTGTGGGDGLGSPGTIPGWYSQGHGEGQWIRTMQLSTGVQGAETDTLLVIDVEQESFDGLDPYQRSQVNNSLIAGGDLPGGRYMMIARVRADGGGRTIRFQAETGGDHSYAALGNEVYTSGGGWHIIGFLFQSHTAEGNQFQFPIQFAYAGNTGAKFIVDYMKVIKVSDDWIDPAEDPETYCEIFEGNNSAAFGGAEPLVVCD